MTNGVSDNVTVINGATDEVVVPSISVGSYPVGVAYDSSNGYVYVTNEGSDNVTVINGATDHVVVPSIPTGTISQGVAFDSSNGYIYVTNYGSDNVTVVNGATDKVAVPSIPVGSLAWGVAFGSSNGYVYVANDGSGNVTVINGATDKVVVPSITVGTGPTGVAFDSSNGYVYVTNSGSNNLTGINGATEKVVVPSIPVGSDPRGVAFDSSNAYVYVANEVSDNVTVINAPPPEYTVTFNETGLPARTPWFVNLTSTVAANVSVSYYYPYWATYDPGQHEVFVSDEQSPGNVTVISDVTDAVVANVHVGAEPQGMAYDTARGEVFVTNEGSDNVSVISDATNTVVANIPVGSDPSSVAYDPVNGELFVANFGSANVSVISDRTDNVVATVAVGAGPTGVAYDLGKGEAFVSCFYAASVSVISNASDKVVATVPVAAGPEGVAYDPARGELMVGSWGYVATVVSDTTDTAVASVTVPSGSVFVAYDSEDRDFYTTGSTFSNNVSLVSSATDQVTGTVRVGSQPTGVTYDAGTGEVFVTDFGSASVSVIASPSYNSNASTLAFSEPNGVYTYAVATPDKLYSATGGAFNVTGAAVSRSVTFRLVTYSVTFLEAGLPNGTAWWVNVTGAPSQGSTARTLSVQLANASYNYTVGVSTVGKKPYSVPGGSFVVNGAVVTEPLTFVLVHPVTFKEKGLPTGTEWWVTVTGQPSTSSTGKSLKFWEPTGSYTYTVGSANRDYATKGGTLTVKTGAVSKTVKFTLVTYSVMFTQAGLPSGAKWCLAVTGGKSYCTTKGSLTFIEPNGTYAYTLTTTKKGYTGAGGNFTVDGAGVSKIVTFVQMIPYTLGMSSPTETNPAAGIYYASLTISPQSGLTTNMFGLVFKTSAGVVVSIGSSPATCRAGAEFLVSNCGAPPSGNWYVLLYYLVNDTVANVYSGGNWTGASVGVTDAMGLVLVSGTSYVGSLDVLSAFGTGSSSVSGSSGPF